MLLHGAALCALVLGGLSAAKPELRPIRVTLVPVPGGRPSTPAAAGVPGRARPPAKRGGPAAPELRAKTGVARPETSASGNGVEVDRAAVATIGAPIVSAGPRGAPALGGVPSGRGVGAGAAAEREGGTLQDRMAQYVEEVRRRIAGQQRYPAAAKLRGVEGVVSVLLAIGPDGRLESVILEGEPNALLARSARSATEAAAPFNPPPDGARRIRVPVRYALR